MRLHEAEHVVETSKTASQCGCLPARAHLKGLGRCAPKHRKLMPHVPAPLAGVPVLSTKLRDRRGHFGGYCPVSWIDHGRLIALLMARGQRTFQVVHQAASTRVLTQIACEVLVRGALLQTGTPPPPRRSICRVRYHWDRTCAMKTALLSLLLAVTVQLPCEGAGPRDWSAIVEADPSARQYKGQLLGLLRTQKRGSCANLKNTARQFCPKSCPQDAAAVMEQLKRGGINGMLAVADSPSRSRGRFSPWRPASPSLGVAECF